MIYDHLGRLAFYVPLHPIFQAAVDFLAANDLRKLPIGKHAIDGERAFVLLQDNPGRGRSGARLEAHRQYIDIQVVLGGCEEIGWRSLAECSQVAEEYTTEREVMFFADEPVAWVRAPEDHFCIFFPQDAHAPLAGEGALRKAVFKIAVEG